MSISCIDEPSNLQLIFTVCVCYALATLFMVGDGFALSNIYIVPTHVILCVSLKVRIMLFSSCRWCMSNIFVFRILLCHESGRKIFFIESFQLLLCRELHRYLHGADDFAHFLRPYVNLKLLKFTSF